MLNFVAAHDENFGMGFKGRLPWPRMAADIERLHKLTKDKTVVMGERTYREYQTVKHAFGTGRVIVLSRSIQTLQDAEVISDLNSIAKRAKSEDIWVIGGGSVFKQLINAADKLYLTVIKGSFKVDTYFPQYSLDGWRVVERQSFPADQNNPYPYTFLKLSRKP